MITGGLLTTSSTTGTILDTLTNAVTSFNGTNATSGNLNLKSSASTLTVTGITDNAATSSVVNLTDTNAAGVLTITGALNAGTNAVNLTANGTSGQITQSGAGVITGGLLTTSSTTGTLLDTLTNVVTSFNGTNTTSGNLNIKSSAATLTVTGITDNAATSSIVNVTDTNASGVLTVTGAFNAGTNAINLISSGQITQSAAGVITGGLLTTNSVTGTLLDTLTNAVTSFNGTNTASGNLNIKSSASNINSNGYY